LDKVIVLLSQPLSEKIGVFLWVYGENPDTQTCSPVIHWNHKQKEQAMPRHQRILVADSSKYFSNTIWRMLIPESEFELVGLTENTAETIKMALCLTPDIILVDLSHSKIRGLQTVIALHSVQPHVPIVTLMPISSYEYTRASMDAGATVCLTKSEIANNLAKTLRNLKPGQLSIEENLLLYSSI
jgi:DNA-binding NarL/FixJ family response regulator